jgi:enoyl-CoA hydratase
MEAQMAVHLEVEAQVATITLDRPDIRNAIDQATAHAISVSIGNADADPGVRVVVITGAGGFFCSGIDTEAMLRGELFYSPANGFAGVTKRVLKKPLIAAVEGCALDGGFEIALACDMIVAAEDAQFGLTEVKEGRLPIAGGLLKLPRQLPRKIAIELIMTGSVVSSGFLASHGLINRVVPRGGALSAARELAATIAAYDPTAVEMIKRVVGRSEDWLASEMFDRQNEITAAGQSSLN